MEIDMNSLLIVLYCAIAFVVSGVIFGIIAFRLGVNPVSYTHLDLIANYLMEYEKVNGEKFEKLMKGEMTFTPRSEEKNISEKPAEQLPSDSDPRCV